MRKKINNIIIVKKKKLKALFDIYIIVFNYG